MYKNYLFIVLGEPIYDKIGKLKSKVSTNHMIPVLILVGGLLYIIFFEHNLQIRFIASIIQLTAVVVLIFALYLDAKIKLPSSSSTMEDFHMMIGTVEVFVAFFYFLLYMNLLRMFARLWLLLVMIGIVAILFMPSLMDELLGVVFSFAVSLSIMATPLSPPVFIVDSITFLYIAYTSHISHEDAFFNFIEYKLHYHDKITLDDVENWYNIRLKIKHGIFIMRLLVPLGFIVTAKLKRERKIVFATRVEEIDPSSDILLYLTIRLPTPQELKINEILGWKPKRLNIDRACELLGIDCFLLSLMAEKYPDLFRIEDDILIYKPAVGDARKEGRD